MSEPVSGSDVEKEVPDEVRRRLALALDVDDLVEAMRLAVSLRPWFGVAKVGLELFSADGPEAIGALRDVGYQVFLDLKLFDIPTTVQRSTMVLGSLGVEYLTLHALRRCRHAPGRGRGSARRCRSCRPSPIRVPWPSPCSPATMPLRPHIVPNRVRLALEGGCGGLVLRGGGPADRP
ncbi:MAG: orotidine 5'-phosphate decarboxylase / HUMPS family protein [Microthrixaceae bacterium]